MKINKRQLIAGIGATTMLPISASAGIFTNSKKYKDIFGIVWETVYNNYCYFDEKKIDWHKARDIYAKPAQRAKNDKEFKAIIARMLRETYDPHTNVHDMPNGYERFPYFDIYAKKINGDYIIKEIKEDSAAYYNGIKPMQKIIAVDDIGIDKLIKKYLPQTLIAPDQEAEDFALNQSLAGRIATPRKITVLENGQQKKLILPLYIINQQPDFESRLLDKNIGYIAIRSFGTEQIVSDFAKAMAEFKNTNGLIIDVRQNGGGDTAYARPIMGWFTNTKKPYAQMATIENHKLSPKWVEYVEPNGDYTYTKPIVVLCNHWSASMAEGFPMGMKAVCGAKIVGTKTMGLGAAVQSEYIKDIDLSYQYSFQPVYDITGTPRQNLSPDIIINNDDDFIAAALKQLI